MIQLAEMLVRPHEESLPKLVLHIPVTPAVDVAPATSTPKIKLFSGACAFSARSSRAEGLWTDCALCAPTATPAVEVPSISSAFPKVPLKIVLPRQPTEEIIMEAPTPSVPKKKKKEKVLTRAERGGMSASDLVACRSVVRKIVSPNRPGLP